MFNQNSDTPVRKSSGSDCDLDELDLKYITLRTKKGKENICEYDMAQCGSSIVEDSSSFLGNVGKKLLSSSESDTIPPDLVRRTPRNGSSKKLLRAMTVTPKNNANNITSNIEFLLSSKPQSTPRRSKTKSVVKDLVSSCNSMKKYSSKTLFPSANTPSNKPVETRTICKSDIRDRSDKAKSNSYSNLSWIDDSDFSNEFQPPCSSTKLSGIGVCLTPAVERSCLHKDLPLSGVKKLNSSANKAQQNFNEPCNPDDNKDDDFPATQPAMSIVLLGVVAYVDVKYAKVNASDNVKAELLCLGAEIEEKFTKRVTHVIFREGTLTTYKMAKRRKIPLVSIVWLNDCKKELKLLPAKGYDPPGLEQYETRTVKNADRDLYDVLNSMRKATSKRKLRRFELERMKHIEEAQRKIGNPISVGKIPVTPTNQETSLFDFIQDFINTQPKDVQDMINCSDSPTEDIHIPIPIKLLRRWNSPRKAKTDIKALERPKNNRESKMLERRKNLCDLLKPPNDEKQSTEQSSSDRHSAPSEIFTNLLKKTDNDKAKLKGSKQNKIEKTEGVNNADNECILGSQTNGGKKRQLLSIDPASSEFLNDSLTESFDQVIGNPYESPKHKRTQKILHKKPYSLKKRRSISKVASRPQLKNVFEKDNSKQLKDRLSTSRRSSHLFISKRNPPRERMVPSIVCTLLNKENEEAIYSIVQHLGRYEIEGCVTARTTHIVVDKENIRTIKLVKGIARGCWIVRSDWVFKSLEANKWISEEKFELTNFSPAVRQNRSDRQAFGPEFRCDLFKDCGKFYVRPNCSPPADDLKEIISLCSGRLVTTARAADVIVGGPPSMMHTSHQIQEKWVLDCITKFKILNYEEYFLYALQMI